MHLTLNLVGAAILLDNGQIILVQTKKMLPIHLAFVQKE
jgi:hypothetical protein